MRDYWKHMGLGAVLVASLALPSTVVAEHESHRYWKEGGPFEEAIERGDVWAVKALLEACSEAYKPSVSDAKKLADWISTCQGVGVDLVRGGHDTRFSRRTPLALASDSGHLDVIAALLAAGADVNDNFEHWGMTPLHRAIFLGRLDVVVALLAAGADVNTIDSYARNRTPLHDASWHGYLDVVVVLLAAGADVNAISTQGLSSPRERNRTPLQEACDQEKYEIVAVLRDAGALDVECAGAP